VKHSWVYIALLAAICLKAGSQSVKTAFIFSNSLDRDDFERRNILSTLQNYVNSAEFFNALILNYSLSDKNLKIDFVFFDRGQISRLKLKDAHSLTAADYSLIWLKRDSLTNRVLFLFVKDFKSSNYRFDRLELSEKLIREHLDRIVLDFIREHLSGDVMEVAKNGCRYLAKAITPVWTPEKMIQARSMVSEPRYFKGHCVSGDFDLSYYDFKPVHFFELTANGNMFEVYDKTDSIRNSHYIILSTVELNSQVQLKKDESGLDGISGWNPEWSLDKNKQLAIVRDDNLAQFVRQINACKMHDPVRKASEWSWEEGTNGFNLVVDNGFVPRNSSNFVEMYLARNEVGSAFPVISPYRKLTWCNVFAKDLAKEILFGFIPWTSNECANRLHFRIMHDKQNFRELDFKKAWELTRKGFIVYLSAFNSTLDPSIYLNKSSEKDVPTSPSGHIATCFPEENKVVQAGTETKVIFYNQVWNSKYGSNYEMVKANLYLGNLLK
jgi:hypothetical protein